MQSTFFFIKQEVVFKNVMWENYPPVIQVCFFVSYFKLYINLPWDSLQQGVFSLFHWYLPYHQSMGPS